MFHQRAKLLKNLGIFKTLRFNFSYFRFLEAIKLPVFIARSVKLKRTEGKVIIDAPIRIRMIRIGFDQIGIYDSKSSPAIWEVMGTIYFRGFANLGQGSKISVQSNAELTLGKEFYVSGESTIVCAKNIIFGDNCLLAWDILVMDTDWHQIKRLEDNAPIKVREKAIPIKIGNHVWIGCRATVLKGVSIADECVIGAQALVTKNCTTSHRLIIGNPAMTVATGYIWER